MDLGRGVSGGRTRAIRDWAWQCYRGRREVAYDIGRAVVFGRSRTLQQGLAVTADGVCVPTADRGGMVRVGQTGAGDYETLALQCCHLYNPRGVDTGFVPQWRPLSVEPERRDCDTGFIPGLGNLSRELRGVFRRAPGHCAGEASTSVLDGVVYDVTVGVASDTASATALGDADDQQSSVCDQWLWASDRQPEQPPWNGVGSRAKWTGSQPNILVRASSHRSPVVCVVSIGSGHSVTRYTPGTVIAFNKTFWVANVLEDAFHVFTTCDPVTSHISTDARTSEVSYHMLVNSCRERYI